MIPVRLQIQGFLSYYESVDLSFDSFDLACISGSNGSGKSSLLDAITWVLFGEARRRDDSIINHRSAAAEVIFDFDYENAHYRVQRSKQKEKTTTLDFFMQNEAGTWRPLTEATLRSTEERIRKTLRLDYETFTNASFFLQGKADQFAQQKPGDRKRILSAILGLEIWDQYKEEALTRRRNVEKELATLEGILSEIDAELSQGDVRRKKHLDLQKEVATKKELRDVRKELLDQQRLISDRWENEKKQAEKLSNEIKRLHNEMDGVASDLENRVEEQEKYRSQIENEKGIRAAHQQWQNQQKIFEKWEILAAQFRQFETQRVELVLKIETERVALQTQLKGLIDKQKETVQLQNQIPALTFQVEAHQQNIRKAEDQLKLRGEIEKIKNESTTEMARLKEMNKSLKEAMEELKQRMAVLEASSGALCPTCEKPLNLVERDRLLNELNTRGTEMGDAYRKNQELLRQHEKTFQEKEAELQALQRIETDLKQTQRLFDLKSEELKNIQSEISSWNVAGQKQMESLQAILQENNFAVEDHRELSHVETEQNFLGYDPLAHEESRAVEVAGRESQQKLSALEQAKSALAPLEREIETMRKNIETSKKHISDQEKVLQVTKEKMNQETSNAPDLQQMENDFRASQEEVNNLLTELGFVQNQVQVLVYKQEEKKTKTSEKEIATQQIAYLKILERAFGKDGIPAILIEQALPEIQEHANNILDRLSAGEMSINFGTQREYRDKKREGRKETLDIFIRDSAGEREYELFSGGEAFRINFAIRLALSRVLARRSGARLQTLVIDEGFGSQDAEGRQRLIEAINMVRADFAKILVITHLEELKDAFSARIEVTKGTSGSQINVVAA
ncbi:MAG: SMC family ATPase [Chloroflexi bacterium]|nr:SMC family ATPase [Chloroflexota bacterium]